MAAIYRRWQQYRTPPGQGKIRPGRRTEDFFKKIKKKVGKLKRYVVYYLLDILRTSRYVNRSNEICK
jgi:hypothetical protein